MTQHPVSRRQFVTLGIAAGVAVAVPVAGTAVAQSPFRGTLPKVQCRAVVNADTIVVEGVGNVALLGIRGPAKDSQGYQKAVDALLKYADKQTILLDTGPKQVQTDDGRFRAMVYYSEDGAWYNLNTKMLRAGLASAVTEPQCHVDTSDWAELVREAKSKGRGLYSMGVDLAETAPPIALAVAPTPRTPRPRPGGAAADETQLQLPAYLRTYVKPEPVAVEILYIGSVSSNRFHRPTCLVTPRELDRVLFEGRLQALKKDFKPCFICRP